MAPPDFVGVGAEKSGTSWWYRLIVSHPGVSHRGRPKEVRYFHRFVDAPFEQADAARYAHWFPRPAGRIAGEWTPSYMSLPGFAGQLAMAAPEARLLVLVRDPIDRLRSALTVRVARWGARFADAPSWMVARGMYASQVERLYEHFRMEAVLVLQFERCAVDAEPHIDRTFRFLGLQPGHRSWLLRRRVNVTRHPPLPLPPDVERDARERYEPEVRRLTHLVPDIDLSLWPNFHHLA